MAHQGRADPPAHPKRRRGDRAVRRILRAGDPSGSPRQQRHADVPAGLSPLQPGRNQPGQAGRRGDADLRAAGRVRR